MTLGVCPERGRVPPYSEDSMLCFWTELCGLTGMCSYLCVVMCFNSSSSNDASQRHESIICGNANSTVGDVAWVKLATGGVPLWEVAMGYIKTI